MDILFDEDRNIINVLASKQIDELLLEEIKVNALNTMLNHIDMNSNSSRYEILPLKCSVNVFSSISTGAPSYDDDGCEEVKQETNVSKNTVALLGDPGFVESRNRKKGN